MQFNDVAPSFSSSSAGAASQQGSSRTPRLLKAAYISFIAGIVLSLLAISPVIWLPTPFLKLSLFAVGVTLAAIFAFLSSIGSIRSSSSVSNLFSLPIVIAGILPALYLVSYLFSADRSIGLLGGGNEVDTVLFVVVGFLTLSLAAFFVRSGHSARTLLASVIAVTGVAVLLQYVVLLSGGHFLTTIFSDKTVNLVGKWNDLGLLAGLAAVVLIAQAELTSMTLRNKVISGVALFLLALWIAIVNFNIAWWEVLGGVLLVIAYKFFTARAARGVGDEAASAPLRPWLSISFAIIAIVFIFAGSSINAHLPSSLAVPSLEVRPGFAATYQIAQDSHAGAPLRTIFGTGANTFVNEWRAHKPAGVNQTQFWSVDFITGFSVLATAFVSVGILGALAWLIPLGLVLFYLLRTLRAANVERKDKNAVFIVGLASIFLWGVAILYAPSQSVMLVAFALTGAFLGYSGALSGSTSSGEASRLSRLLALVLMLVVVAVLVSASAMFVRRTLSASYQQRGALALSGKDTEAAAAFTARSQQFERTGDNLRLGLEIDLARMQILASASTTPEQATALQTQFQALLQEALGQGQGAALLNPRDYQPYVEMANVYDFLAQLNVQGAYDSEKQALEAAIDRNATNPALPLLLARTLAAQNLSSNLADVEKLINQSLVLKNNYTDAFLLAEQIAVAQKDLPTATAAAKAAVQSAPDQASLWFQLGLFYYVGNSMSDAVTALQNAITLVPNYANAQYFLGLAYYKEGRTQDAVAQFQSLAGSNPDNQEVKLILSNLQAGKDPLAGENPPVEPTDRKQAPIKE